MQNNKAVTLRYYGHCAFQWSTPKGVHVLVDPYRNQDPYRDLEDNRWLPEWGEWFIKNFPLVETDFLLVTHPHFDHDAVECIPGFPTIIRTPGKFQYKDLIVQGISDYHAGRWGQQGMKNIIFVVEIGGLRFCHLGDNRSQLPLDVYRDIKGADILMIPVDDSCHLLTFKEVDNLIALVDPKIVIPMHYLIPEITIKESTLKTVEEWLNTQKVVRLLEHHTVSLSSANLPGTREVWVLVPYQATE